MDPVDPAARWLDAAHLATFPRATGTSRYLQSKNGFTIKDNLPGLRGEAVETLYAEGAAWLNGSPTPGEPTATGLKQDPPTSD